MKHISRFTSAVIGALAMLAAQPSFADDSEVFTNSAFLASGVRPNVLFIIDTSGSMNTTVNVYDPTVTYEGPCAANRIFWRTTNSSTPPDCGVDEWISVANNRCRAAATGMAANGWWRGRVKMIVPSGSSTQWGALDDGRDAKIECQLDRGVHGNLPGTTAPGTENKYARNGGGSAESNRWGTSGSTNQVTWGDTDNRSLYTSNYANWWHGNPGDGTPRSRLDIVQRAANLLIDNLDGVNLGIMRYSTDAQGGMVRYPVSELTAANRAALKAEINAYEAAGNTPLSETLYEAYLYLSGGRVDYGNRSSPQRSIDSSRVGGLPGSDTYDSPMDFSCQNTYVVYLTDGLPTTDNDADEEIVGLPDFAEDGVACEGTDNGRCLEALTRYMHNHDISPTFGEQNVTTYYIGFGEEIADSAQFLEDAAAAGGGRAYTANDAGGLASTLEAIFTEVQEASDTTFVSPAVSVNAFNRTQNLNDLFVSVFQPSKNFHWAGNIKKYRIIDGEIYGVDEDTPAVDPATGFFHTDAQALNTPGTTPDGPDATRGGSAARLPSWRPGERDVYTYLGTETRLSDAANAVEVDNTALTAAMLNAVDDTERERFIEFARGRDLTDLDGDEDLDESRLRMGDPMHARPAIVIYGGDAANPTGTVFAPSNDGYLHAFDMATGDEKWAFIPEEFLPRIENLHDNPPAPEREYSLDGDVRVFKYDVNQNGAIDTGDKVYLFFGTRRGGSTYYSLDVTDPENPVFRWTKTATDLPKLGKAWSTPEIARVNIAGASQNDQRFVLIFGGGYDTSQDGYNYTLDDVGNAIYMLDLESGDLLWHASNEDADFNHDDMTHSIPSGITVFDTDGDFFADRMYAADLGGRVWRFDIWNGEGAGSLVTGGVLASLGGAANPASQADNRRFYGSPDVSPISTRGSRPYFNIAIGSGYRGHPLHMNDDPGVNPAEDRFYAIRDYSPFTKRTAASYAAATPIVDGDLEDITDVVSSPIEDGSPGWKLELRLPEWRGEKVLGDSTTAAGVIFFTTFTPLTPDPQQPCLARTLNRVYAVYATNGRPFTQWDEEVPDDEWSVEDRYEELAQKGIAPPVQILPNRPGPGICQVGAQILNRCVKFGDAVRSYWEHR
jgi:type IV pilus assembly protein PilY1